MLSLGVTILMHEFVDLTERLAFVVALFAVFTFNLFALRLYVFRKDGFLLTQAARYAYFSLAFRVGEFIIYLIFLEIKIPYWVALTIVLMISNLVKYFVFRAFVFR